MNRAKFVMFLMAIAAISSMMGIGYSIAVKSAIGAIVCIIAMCFIFMTGFKLKRKFREAGLL